MPREMLFPILDWTICGVRNCSSILEKTSYFTKMNKLEWDIAFAAQRCLQNFLMFNVLVLVEQTNYINVIVFNSL